MLKHTFMKIHLMVYKLVGAGHMCFPYTVRKVGYKPQFITFHFPCKWDVFCSTAKINH